MWIIDRVFPCLALYLMSMAGAATLKRVTAPGVGILNRNWIIDFVLPGALVLLALAVFGLVAVLK